MSLCPDSIHRSAALGLAIVVVTASGPAAATAQEDPLVTDRPDFTESPVAVTPGRVQLEGGYTFEEAGDVESHSLGEILLRIGVIDGLELRLGINSYVSVDFPGGEASGLEDSSIGIKLEMAEGSSEPDFMKPAMALLIGTTLPTGSSEVSVDDPQPGVLLALDWPMAGSLGIASNVGLAYVSDGRDQFAEASFSVAFGGDLSKRLGGFVEYYTLIPESAHGDDQHFFDTGLTYGVSEDFQLDFRVGTALEGETDLFAGVGLAYRW